MYNLKIQLEDSQFDYMIWPCLELLLIFEPFLCTHQKGFGYKDSYFHRIIDGFMAQAHGTGGKSIYGEKFSDQNFKIKHTEPYMLSMANSGLDTNGSQFFITFAPCPQLDGKYVAFGQVIQGRQTVDLMEKLGTKSGIPKSKVKIIQCDEI